MVKLARKSAKVAWSAVPAASRYEVRLVRAGVAGKLVMTSGTSRTLKSLKHRTSYQVQVAAVTPNGTGAPATIDFTTR
jgi:hypothetical protein